MKTTAPVSGFALRCGLRSGLHSGLAMTFAWAAIATALPVLAQESPTACHAVVDPTGRLLCYDRVTARPDPAVTAASPETPATAAAIPAPPTALARAAAAPAGESPQSTAAPTATAPSAATEATPRSTRGLPSPPPPPAEARVEPSSIVQLEQTSIGRYRFHLGNGEVWEQLEPGRITVRQGDTVDVQQTTFGSWQLREVDGSSRSVRVRRVE